MIDDAINDQEIGTSMLQTLMAGAQAQTVQKDQQFKSDNSLHKKLDTILARQDDQAIEIAKLKTGKRK